VSNYQAWYDCSQAGRRLQRPRLCIAKVFPHVKALELDQRDVHTQHTLNAKLFSNREAMFFEFENYSMAQALKPLSTNVENVIQSVVSTLVSRIGTNRPKASIISRGADFSVFLKARQLDRFLWAEFVHQGIHRKLERCFKDACIYGTGFLKIDSDAGEVYCERVHPSEIIVDQRECISNEMPMQMHQRKLVSKLWLKKTYAQKGMKNHLGIAKAIDACGTQDDKYVNYQGHGVDQVVILESWKLATRKGADDGRHTVCIENYTLVDEAYTRDRFPFVIQKWEEPESGFYGRSLIGDLIGYQLRLNDLNDTITLAQDLMCVPRLLVEAGSGIQVGQLDNRIAKAIKYRGTKPEALTWGAVNAELYNERDRIRSSAFEFAGISQLSAQGKLPSQARLDSSEALREVNAIEDTRFNDKTQAFERAAKEAASQLIENYAKVYKGKKKTVSRTFRLGNLAQQIEWKDVDMEEDKYVLEIGASSILNMTPAARKDILNSWMAGGIITPDQYKAWSGHEDLERLADTMSASKDIADHHMDKMLKGTAMTPDPNMNLQFALPYVLDTYNHISSLEAPEEVKGYFRNWILATKNLLQPPAPPMPPMGAAPPMGPEAGMVPPGPEAGMPAAPPAMAAPGM
jgi:hypothetical protein